jgi:lysophospholipase L1-like esterase
LAASAPSTIRGKHKTYIERIRPLWLNGRCIGLCPAQTQAAPARSSAVSAVASAVSIPSPIAGATARGGACCFKADAVVVGFHPDLFEASGHPLNGLLTVYRKIRPVYLEYNRRPQYTKHANLAVFSSKGTGMTIKWIMKLKSVITLTPILAALLVPTPATAQSWTTFDSDARYVALGDSISAGYGVTPATRGFPYQLYQSSVINNLNATLFAMMAVPGALSSDVLNYQVPQVKRFLHETGTPHRQVVTLLIGGNDLFQIMEGSDPIVVLNTLGTNLFQIISTLKAQTANVEIYVGTLYDPRLPVPGGRDLILAGNQVIANVVSAFKPDSVFLVDLYSAFEGRNGLLLIEKHGAGAVEAHPTAAGHQVIADTFAAVIRRR